MTEICVALNWKLRQVGWAISRTSSHGIQQPRDAWCRLQSLQFQPKVNSSAWLLHNDWSRTSSCVLSSGVPYRSVEWRGHSVSWALDTNHASLGHSHQPRKTESCRLAFSEGRFPHTYLLYEPDRIGLEFLRQHASFDQRLGYLSVQHSLATQDIVRELGIDGELCGSRRVILV